MLTLPLLGHGQPTTSTEGDSTQLVGIPRWVHWRALHDLALYRQCDSLVNQYRAQVKHDELLIAKADSLNRQAQDLIAIGDSINVRQEARLKNHEELILTQADAIRTWQDRFVISSGAALGASIGGMAAGAPGAAVGLVVGAGIGWLVKWLL